MTIFFTSPRDEPYGCFSNFSRHGFRLDGKQWPTSEHYFQAQKFAGTPHLGDVLRAPSPAKAAAIGRDRGRPLRSDWEQVKDDVMRRAVLAKFQQNDDIRAVLLDTGDAELVENAPNDDYWGCGADGSGQNRLGQILMDVRATLREEAPLSATRDTKKAIPLSETRATLDFKRTFSQGETACLRQGFVPRDMDDRWFIFLEDDWLYFHRSWTGFCVFQVRLEPAGDGYTVAETWACRDPEQYRWTSDSSDVAQLNRLINHLLLREQ